MDARGHDRPCRTSSTSCAAPSRRASTSAPTPTNRNPRSTQRRACAAPGARTRHDRGPFARGRDLRQGVQQALGARRVARGDAERDPEVDRTDDDPGQPGGGGDRVDVGQRGGGLDHHEAPGPALEDLEVEPEVGTAGAEAAYSGRRVAAGGDGLRRLLCAVDERHDDGVGPGVEQAADRRGVVVRDPHGHGVRGAGQRAQDRRGVALVVRAVLAVQPDPVVTGRVERVDRAPPGVRGAAERGLTPLPAVAQCRMRHVRTWARIPSRRPGTSLDITSISASANPASSSLASSHR